MCEILFRGRKTDHIGRKGEWVEGWYVKTPQHLHGHLVDFISIADYDEENKHCLGNTYHMVDPETICQFTGKCDGNDVKIFEHDIVQFDDDCCAEILWDKEDAMFTINGGDVSDIYENFSVVDSESIIVIGNIFDNPELMEGV